MLASNIHNFFMMVHSHMKPKRTTVLKGIPFHCPEFINWVYPAMLLTLVAAGRRTERKRPIQQHGESPTLLPTCLFVMMFHQTLQTTEWHYPFSSLLHPAAVQHNCINPNRVVL